MASENPPGTMDVRRADAAYRSFPSFMEWSSGTTIDPVRWDRYARLLQERRELTPELLARARDVAKRAAAVDTGAIEGLYEVDRGFTFSVAMQMATWEAQLDAKGQRVRAIIEAQLSAYDFVLDFATQRLPVAEAWIRTLHEVICAGQETYSVYTEIGLQEHPLPMGRYKALPNHVLRADGVTHAYAPVDLVQAEMQRFCAETHSPEFTNAHPVHQSAYAHYCMTVIHPFADGNGRVARALASVFTYRALSVPIVILAEHRLDYYDALEAADGGEYQRFNDFILERTLDSIQLVSETLKAAGVPAPVEATARLKRVYLTRGGFSQSEVDQAGYRLFEALEREVERQAAAVNSPELRVEWAKLFMPSSTVVIPSHRLAMTELSSAARITFATSPPARRSVERELRLEVPRDSGKEDDLIIRSLTTDEIFEVRITEAHPSLTGTVQLRLSVFVHALLGRAIAEISELAENAMREPK
jgi:Fic family protein